MKTEDEIYKKVEVRKERRDGEQYFLWTVVYSTAQLSFFFNLKKKSVSLNRRGCYESEWTWTSVKKNNLGDGFEI